MSKTIIKEQKETVHRNSVEESKFKCFNGTNEFTNESDLRIHTKSHEKVELEDTV